MNDELISLKTAKSAKEKGFDWTTNDCYDFNGHTYLNGWCERLDDFFEDNNFTNSEIESKGLDDYYTAPTQSLLQRWLREEFEVEVMVKSDFYQDKLIFIYSTHNLGESSSYYYGDKIHESYEFALEVGLFEALKLIKDD